MAAEYYRKRIEDPQTRIYKKLSKGGKRPLLQDEAEVFAEIDDILNRLTEREKLKKYETHAPLVHVIVRNLEKRRNH